MSQSSPAPAKKSVLDLSNSTYTTLKHIASVGLPALSTLYFTLASVWHWHDTVAIGATIAAINVFVGGFMTLSSNSYASTLAKYAGDLLVHNVDSGKSFSIQLNSAVQAVEHAGEALLRVVPTTAPNPTLTPPSTSVLSSEPPATK